MTILIFSLRKCVWNSRPRNSGHFVSASMCYNTRRQAVAWRIVETVCRLPFSHQSRFISKYIVRNQFHVNSWWLLIWNKFSWLRILDVFINKNTMPTSIWVIRAVTKYGLQCTKVSPKHKKWYKISTITKIKMLLISTSHQYIHKMHINKHNPSLSNESIMTEINKFRDRNSTILNPKIGISTYNQIVHYIRDVDGQSQSIKLSSSPMQTVT